MIDTPRSILHSSEASRTLAVLMARGKDENLLFGKLRFRKDRGVWRIDARPYGWIGSLDGMPFGANEDFARACSM